MLTRRSYLFVPGKNAAVTKKAVSSEADCVILDLEDAVAVSEKSSARDMVKESLRNFTNEKQLIVRINAMNTPYWEEDLAAAIHGGASGVMLPKADSGKDIAALCEKIRELSEEKDPDIEVFPMIESAQGVQFAYEIASADRLVTALAFGSIDFSLDIGCELTADGLELLFARSQIVIASSAAGIGAPIDAVYPDLLNPEGLEKEARSAKQLGFKGKLIIHPKQMPLVHEVFSPSEREIEQAKEIVAAFEKAEKNGVASIEVQGQFVDYPVYKKAKNTLTAVLEL
ncbi:HpcH/HpaI aldolase/citrate lyase family protein [Planococcus salinus]|uniref:CoA ester lyase n=1 Tax=Planococcus salinus TaxID=1848460 RepID=A0A3M8PA37_9BACL|nr:CoA ester lyase [Planococcus salinus]RNF40251.1 CoA ester lyase [Planococcus salinus]